MSAIETVDPMTLDLSAELRAAHSKLLQSRIRVTPVNSVRASSIGNDCDMYLFLEQTAHEKRVAHGEFLQALFDLGNEMERYTVRLVEDMGFIVENRNHSFHNREFNITGHLDGRLWKEGWRRRVPIEIKGLNPYTADQVTTLDHIRYSKQKWVRKYYSQLQIYQDLDEAPVGLFILLNKSTGRPEFIESPYDAEHVALLKARALRVKTAIATNVPPERTRSSDCLRCPFAHVCLPDVDYGGQPEILDEVELIEAISVRESNREGKAKFEAADRVIKGLMPPKPGTLLIGPYTAQGVQQTREAHAVSASSYVKWTIKQTGELPTSQPILDPATGPRYPALVAVTNPPTTGVAVALSTAVVTPRAPASISIHVSLSNPSTPKPAAPPEPEETDDFR